MYKYLCAIILGILIYILLNQYNSFSVGSPRGACTRPPYIENDDNDGNCHSGKICRSNSNSVFDTEGGFNPGSCVLRQDTKRWNDLNAEQQEILTNLYWDENSWDNPVEEFEPHIQFETELDHWDIRVLRSIGMPDEFLNKFNTFGGAAGDRGTPGALCRLENPNPDSRDSRCDSGRACQDDGNCPITGECDESDESRQCQEKYFVCVDGACMLAADEDVDHLGTPGALCRPEGPSPYALRCDDGQGCLANDHCPIAAAAAAPAPDEGEGGAAGPYCSSPDSVGPCAAVGGGAAAAVVQFADAITVIPAAASPPVQPEIDPSVSPIDLRQIRVDYRSGAPTQRIDETDCRPMINPVKIEVRKLKLKYVSGGADVPLRFVSYLSEGVFGYVCRYASHARDQKGEANYIAIAVKFYKKKDNAESRVIRLINTTTLKSCGTVTALVLEYHLPGVAAIDRRENNKLEAGLMRLMDGDCKDLFQDYTLTEREIYIFLQDIVTYLKCISALGYVYTDLKLANCLFKIQDGSIAYRLGDLDSISKSPKINAVQTYITVEYIIGRAPYYVGFQDFRDVNVYWAIGCMVANAYYEFEKYENPSLPSHWVKKKGKYRPYYVNTSINVTTWFHPGTLMQPLLDLIGQDKVKKIADLHRKKNGHPSQQEIIISNYYKSINSVLTGLLHSIPKGLYDLFRITLCPERRRRRISPTSGYIPYDRILHMLTALEQDADD